MRRGDFDHLPHQLPAHTPPVMAEPEVVISEDEPVVDEDMGDAEVEATDGADVEGEDATGLEDIEPEVATKTTFLE